jgi:hypothetical protein
MSRRRKKAAGKGKEEEMKYAVPGNPVDSFCPCTLHSMKLSITAPIEILS